MTSIGEELADGYDTCKCGSNNICVETTTYFFIKRNKKQEVIGEYDSDGDYDLKYTCSDCGEEIK